MTDDQFKNLKNLLEDSYTFPCEYKYKFIVKFPKCDELKAKMKGFEIVEKPSKNGNFVSLTVTGTFETSDAIIEVYHRVAGIEGVISL
ncbi:MAG: DUF493 domain-containing protein [Halobacteriovoraceae bacterium]|jgi:uncharacterized protein|nr:DUF493 domain-containing protein [Halobacteriovoraceae bacterium]MBT5094803.1 DUF493 domain-containing protein [Halobacteriovoraceae bacterium]